MALVEELRRKMEEDVVGEAAGEHVEDFGADGELAFPGKLGEREAGGVVDALGAGACHLGREDFDCKTGIPGGRKKYFCQHESWFNEASRLIQKYDLIFWRRRRPVSALSDWSSQSVFPIQ